jgi:6,7-dimethyl-8-ribityllumazine synthase
MHETSSVQLDASSLRIGIAISRYHREITDGLLAGAVDVFQQAGGDQRNLQVIDAPGAWELTAICRAMSLLEGDTGRPALDAIVTLGCILSGETTHDQCIAQSVTQGLTAITLQSGVPIAFGVLTCQTMEQARVRAGLAKDGLRGGTSNKGAEAMQAAIAAATTVRDLRKLNRSLLKQDVVR